MTDNDLIALLAEAVEIDPEVLSPATEIESVPEWTSMTWLTIMSMADDRLGVQLAAGQIRNFRTVSDVVAALREPK